MDALCPSVNASVSCSGGTTDMDRYEIEDRVFTNRYISAQNDPAECARIYQEREIWRKGEVLKNKGYPVTPENLDNADYLLDKKSGLDW